MQGMATGFFANSPAIRIPTRGRSGWPNSDFKKGSLRVVSYARPGKLFTANQELLVSEVGVLGETAFNRVLDAVIGVLRPSKQR